MIFQHYLINLGDKLWNQMQSPLGSNEVEYIPLTQKPSVGFITEKYTTQDTSHFAVLQDSQPSSDTDDHILNPVERRYFLLVKTLAPVVTLRRKIRCCLKDHVHIALDT